MFYTMINDLRQNHFILPSYTSYNHMNIPYAYPPFAFYVAAAISLLPHVSLISLFHFLPFLLSSLTIPLFYLLSKNLVQKESTRLIATFLFAMLPRSYEWLIMGGGLTRSFGLIFSLCTLHIGLQFLSTKQTRYFFVACIFFALTLLSHIEYAYFVFIFSLLLFAFTIKKERKTFFL